MTNGTTFRVFALLLSVVIAAPSAAVAQQQPQQPTQAEIEAEIEAAERALLEAEAEAAAAIAEAEARAAEAEARAEAAEADAAETIEAAGQIVDEAEALIAGGGATPAIQTFQPVVEQGRRRSVPRTLLGVLMIGGGIISVYNGARSYYNLTEDADRLKGAAARAQTLMDDYLYWGYDPNGWHVLDARDNRDHLSMRAIEQEEIANRKLTIGTIVGVALVALGSGMTGKWAFVDSPTVAVNVSPDGGIRASKTFGW